MKKTELDVPRPKLIWLDGKRYQVGEVFEWNGVCVPKDFITDGASIPRIFHIWAIPSGPHFPAALIHDYRYCTQTVSKKIADVEFYSNLLKCNLRGSKAYVMYQAVNWFGYLAWWKNKKKIKKGE